MKHDNDQTKGRHAETSSEARLRWQLRGLRRDVPPQRDLWPRIAERIAATPVAATRMATPRRGIGRGWAPLALAASLLLAIGLAWQLRPLPGPAAADTVSNAPGGRLVKREAEAMTREYGAALRELHATTPGTIRPPSEVAALRTLDRSAEEIRAALSRDPDARFLLQRLHSTYAQRLALTQRATLT